MIKEQLWHFALISDPVKTDITRTVFSECNCLKEIGQNWPNRCSCLSNNNNNNNNNNNTLCLSGAQLNCSCWFQGPSAKSWIQILWIYHTHWRTSAFESSEWIILFQEWAHPFQKITSCFSGPNFPRLLSKHNSWKQCVRTHDYGKCSRDYCNKYVRYIN